jgi:hypothetical protein
MIGLFYYGSKKPIERTIKMSDLNIDDLSDEVLGLMMYRLTLEKCLAFEKLAMYQLKNACFLLFFMFTIASLPLLYSGVVGGLAMIEVITFVGAVFTIIMLTSSQYKQFSCAIKAIEDELKEINIEIEELLSK